jgi:hypothetical protein
MLANGNALARIKTDGTGFERVPTVSVLDKRDEGEWVIIQAPPTGDRSAVEVMAVPLRGGVPRRVCVTDRRPRYKIVDFVFEARRRTLPYRL